MPRDRETFTSMMDTVDEGYFETMGIPDSARPGLPGVRHRGCAAGRGRERALRETLLAGRRCCGKHIRLDSRTGAPVEIVGVARNDQVSPDVEKPTDFVYLPLAQHPVARMVLMLRSSGDPLQLVEPVKDVVRALDPNLPMFGDEDL